MAAVDDSSDADDEEKLVGCFGEEANEDFWFTDGKSTHIHLPCQPLTS